MSQLNQTVRRPLHGATVGVAVLALIGSFVTGPVETATAAPGAQTWVVAYGDDIVEQTAGENLAQALDAAYGEATAIEVAEVPGDLDAWIASLAGDAADPDGVVVLGTASTNPLLAAAAARIPFDLSGESVERFALRGETAGTRTVVYVAGATPKGSQVGAVRLKNELRLGTDLGTLNATGAPAFTNRVAGNVQTQGRPDGWTVEDQAQYYVDNNINVVWGEKYGPMNFGASYPLILPEAVLEEYGLGLALEVTLPPVPSTWFDDPARASATCIGSDGSATRRVIDPFAEVGAQAYYDAFSKALSDYPSLAILYTIFGDYSHVPRSDKSSCARTGGAAYDKTLVQTVTRIMEIMKAAIADAGKTGVVTPSAWFWHLFTPDDKAAMIALGEAGIGVIYNEAGNGDDWITNRDNFDDIALAQNAEGELAYGPDYAVLVSAGGACESIDPVIGLPTPAASGYKLARLREAGVQNFFLWWGSGEGWSYSANMGVVAEMIMNPDAFSSENIAPWGSGGDLSLLQRIAARDFGPQAAGVLRFWGMMDDALVADWNPADDEAARRANGRDDLDVHSWNQRLGVYTLPAVFGGAWDVPITPAGMAREGRFRLYDGWTHAADTIPDFTAVLANTRAALAFGRTLDAAEGSALDQMLDQTELWTLIFASQLHVLEAIEATRPYWTQTPPPGHQDAGTGYRLLADTEDPGLRAALEPIAAAEIKDMLRLVELVSSDCFPSNFSLSGSSATAALGQGNKAKDLEGVKGKIMSMQLWLDDLQNLALNKPAAASSSQPAGDKPARVPGAAVDGDASTLWHSAYRDDEWLSVDLGRASEISAIVVNWNGNAPANTYRLEAADSPDGPWRTLVNATSSRSTDAFPLDRVVARYVRMYGLTRASPYGFAINELEVYGTASVEPPAYDGPGGQCAGEGSDGFEGEDVDLARWSASLGYPRVGDGVVDGAVNLQTISGGFTNTRLVAQPFRTGAWELTTAASFNPTVTNAQSGLIVWQNDQNYLALDILANSCTAGSCSRVVEFKGKKANAPAPDGNVGRSPTVPAGAAVWLRLVSDGENLTGYHSTDEGATFTKMASRATLTGLAPTAIGLYALSPNGASTAASYDWMEFAPSDAELAACTADRSGLLDLIEDAAATASAAPQGEGDGQYPPSAVAALQEAILAARQVADRAQPSQREVDQARDTLVQALAAFEASVVTVDFGVLDEALAAVRSLVRESYADTSWSALQSLVAQATTVRNTAQVAQADVDAATATLTGFELVRRGDPIVLQTLLQVADSLADQLAGFTEASLSTLEGARASARTVYDGRSDKTQAQVDAAAAALLSALDGLAAKPPAVPKPSADTSVLRHGYDAAKGLTNLGGRFTAATWSKLQAELVDAKRVLDDQDASQAQVDQAAQELSSAVSALAAAVQPPVSLSQALSAALSKVKLNQSQLRLVKGASFTLEEGVYYRNAHTSYAAGVTWTSSRPKVATVSSSGTIRARKTGTVTITATTIRANAAGKRLSAKITVTVVATKPRARVTRVAASVPRTMKKGTSAYITGRYASSRATGIKVSYRSSRLGVASVDPVGRILAKGKGTTTITVRAGTKTHTYKVTVR